MFSSKDHITVVLIIAKISEMNGIFYSELDMFDNSKVIATL